MSAYCGLPVVCTLTLGTRVLDLMTDALGFRIASLDLGYPEVREDTTDQPDHAGTIDTTTLFGGRAVTISGTIVPSPGGSRSASLGHLTPFLDPAARPILTYQTEADVAPRTLTLRASSLGVPFDSPNVTTWSVSWKAPNGLALGTTDNAASIGPSFLVNAGRVYNLTFDRRYPAGLPSNSIVIVPSGDYPTPPKFTITGPAQAPQLTVAHVTGPPDAINFQPGYVIPPGHFVVVDCGTRTIVDDAGNNVYGLALASFAVWPKLIPNEQNTVSFFCTNAAAATGVVIEWRDRWLI